MKEENLSVSVKRVCQTTRSVEGPQPWINRVQTLEISRPDQVWVGDITYVRLKRRFIYVAVLMDIFTRMIRGWQVSQHLSQSLTLKPLEAALRHSVCEIHHSDQGAQYLSKAGLTQLPCWRGFRTSPIVQYVSTLWENCVSPKKLMLPRSKHRALRFPSHTEAVLGRTDMLKG